MTKTEFIQRAVLALMAGNFQGATFSNDPVSEDRIKVAESQWDALVRAGYVAKGTRR